MLRLIAPLLLIATPAAAQTASSYLVFPTQAACLARSQQQCQAMGCDGVHTVYWSDCSTGPLQAGLVGPNAVPAGSYAMRIDSSGAAPTNVAAPSPAGLTAAEQAKLATAAQLPAVQSQAVP